MKEKNQQLIQNTLHSLSDFLPKIANTCLSIADLFRANKDGEAFKYIQQFIEAIDWSIQAINGIKNLESSLNIDTNEINEFLSEAKKGLELNDLVLIADMFEYEICPIIEKWIAEVQSFHGEYVK
ncbi:hypothetical protein [Calidifontibacillus erzurumensis]|uniref:DUF8042 domain-containing protein n=1 Tax=Calidifontibacillus erzurumensis TaxID=2741433 RepID=A0A8J8KC85_9BACI|nr:hypothetical protein [Calidifontibacillus erzurumensis]NSL51788.1 hypothetical protein [Calidifontibacillus erzurumensis]